MSNSYTNIILVDSTINADQFLKFDNNFNIISFDNTTHRILLQNKIKHEISDQYTSRNDLDNILKHSMLCARWYLLPEIKEIISFLFCEIETLKIFYFKTEKGIA